MAFTCPKCGMTSHNPNDEREGYCGNCHDWTGRGPDIWVGNNDGSRMEWRYVSGAWKWQHLDADGKVLAEGEGGP